MKIEFPDSVCCLFAVGSREVMLVEQWRRVHEKFTLELPGGIIEEGESPEEAGLREFREETGIRLSMAELVLTLDMDFSKSKHRTYVVYARDPGVTSCGEAEEGIASVKTIGIEKVLDMIGNARITHAPTVAALLWFARNGPGGPM